MCDSCNTPRSSAWVLFDSDVKVQMCSPCIKKHRTAGFTVLIVSSLGVTAGSIYMNYLARTR